MAERKADAKSPEAKAAREAKRAEKQAAEQRAAEELERRRNAQLAGVRLAIGELDEAMRVLADRERRREDLADHLAGFYEEIDKLAKGRAMLEVTDLVLDETNQIIRDAKAIVRGDSYLSRVKEFVPAGNNPVYPDVVVALRTVRQALDRAKSQIDGQEEDVDGVLAEAQTVELALTYLLENDEAPSLATMKHLADRADGIALSWFEPGYTEERRLFDVERLDAIPDVHAQFPVPREE